MFRAKALFSLASVLVVVILLLATDTVCIGAAHQPAQIVPHLGEVALGPMVLPPQDLAQPADIPVTDDLLITESVAFQPGVYNIEDVHIENQVIGNSFTHSGDVFFHWQ